MQKSKGRYIVKEKGKKTAAILPIKEYEELLEDLHDVSIVAERRDESYVYFDKLKERLKKYPLKYYGSVRQNVTLGTSTLNKFFE